MSESWLRAAILAALGCAVVFLPQRLSGHLRSARPQTAPRPAAKPPELQAVEEGMKLLLSSRGQEVLNERLSAEERQLQNDVKPKVVVLANPVLERLLKMSAPGPRPAAAPRVALEDRARSAAAEHGERLAAALNLAAGAAVAAALLALGLGLRGGGRFLAGWCHSLAGMWLWVLALAGLVAATAWRLDIWSILPPQLWGTAVAALLASAALLHAVDFNVPVWNGTFSALLVPLLSVCASLGFDRLGGWIGRLQ